MQENENKFNEIIKENLYLKEKFQKTEKFINRKEEEFEEILYNKDEIYKNIELQLNTLAVEYENMKTQLSHQILKFKNENKKLKSYNKEKDDIIELFKQEIFDLRKIKNECYKEIAELNI